jgi:hypothetical protein
MRSTNSYRISCREVHQWALDWLLQAKLLRDHGWRCTATVVWSILLRAAARSISPSAACRDLSDGPSDHAVMCALDDGLPKTLSVLERRVNEALASNLPRCLLRHRWSVAIDWHLSPCYGQPQRVVLRQAPPRHQEVSRLTRRPRSKTAWPGQQIGEPEFAEDLDGEML